MIRLLDALLPPDLHHLVGDLEEEFTTRSNRDGAAMAHLALAWHCARALPFILSEFIKWNTLMIAHYLKTGLRVIRRHVSYSIINVAGLAAGMAVCLLILLFIVDQKSYDRFHENADDIYRITTLYNSPVNENPQWYATSPASLEMYLEESVPGVVEGTRLQSNFRGEIWHNEEALSLQGIYAAPDFFDLFDFKLVSGDPETALRNPASILLTPRAAARLFGEDKEPIGETITALGDRDYTVTGLVEPARRSHIRFDSIVSMSTLTAEEQSALNESNWRRSLNNSYTYLRMDEATAERLETRFPEIISQRFEDSPDSKTLHDFDLQRITDINLGTEYSNEVGMVIPSVIGWFLTGFGAIIMLIAGFNYVSLTIARSLNRGKEIGVRRVLGAFRGSIFNQFLLESVLMAGLALIFAFGLLNVLLPRFNSLFVINMSENQISIDLFSDFWIYGLFLLFSLAVGLLAGLYPARLFTSFEPVNALGGQRSTGRISRQTLRKLITVTQFTFALIFIITSIVLVRQFRFMSQTDYGFDEEQLVNVALQDIPYQRLRERIEDDPDVVSVAASSKVPALGSISSVRIESDSISGTIVAHEFSVDENFLVAMGLTLLAGRNFDPQLSSDSTTAIILGQSAAERLGLGQPGDAVGSSMRVRETTYRVIGVIEDFISNNPAASGDPIILRQQPDRFRYAVVKVGTGRINNFLPRLERQWVELGSIYTAKYEIFDEQLRSTPMIAIFGDLLRVFGVVAVFSLMISCLGLLGMAMYSARSRVKEIGVRKVLGATRSSIVLLLSREYLWLVGIAVMIGGPLAWLLNSFWLGQLSNSIELGPVLFASGIAGTTAVALLTIATQTLKASKADVVDNLRSE